MTGNPVIGTPVTVTVRYYVLFCIAAGYCREEEFRLKPEPRMADLVEVICQKYGDEFRHKIFSREGTLKSTAWFILNGIKLAEDPLSTKLKNGDILILSSPLLVGG